MFPKEYVDSMKRLLSDQWMRYEACMAQAPITGLFINNKRISKADFLANPPFEVTESSLCTQGVFVQQQGVKCGTYPEHDAGMYYVQEPSAMSAPSYFNVQNGDIVLDLCAAPGGKSVQLASMIGLSGLLVANEIHPARATILCENLERMGFGHTAVFNESPERLAKRFSSFFTKILVDAPCSGEGMFRKDPATIAQWSAQGVEACHIRQVRILREAAKMLMPGGCMLYSTCTFNQLENEGTIQAFLAEHSDFKCVSQTRLYPFDQPGEGHFIALLEKSGHLKSVTEYHFLGQQHDAALKPFIKSDLGFARIERFGKYICALSPLLPSLDGLKVVRAGLQLYEPSEKFVKPAHSLAMWLTPAQALHFVMLDEPDARRYLRGEAIETQQPAGWTLVCYRNCPLGWGKAITGRIQNHRPKGLRHG